MDSVQEYYIVPKEVYEKCSEPKKSVEEKIQELPTARQRKFKRLLDYLVSKIGVGVTVDKDSDLVGEYTNLYDFINYAISGRKKPDEFNELVPLLFDVPDDLLSEKVHRDVGFFKRQHGRHIHKKSLD